MSLKRNTRKAIWIIVIVSVLLVGISILIMQSFTNSSEMSQEAQVFQGTSNPQTSGNVKDLPTSAPLPNLQSTVAVNDIQLTISKTTFNQGETIEIITTNKGAGVLSYFIGPGCGIVIERKVGNAWVSQVISTSEYSRAPCYPVTLSPNESKTETKTIDNSPPSGAYRIHLKYDKGSVYSSEFTIR